MKNFPTGLWLSTFALCLLAGSALAQTGYVSDMLILTFREGPGTSFPVIRTLRSNTPLTVLEEEKGYYKVSLSSGEQGWVDKQFVLFETPKTELLKKANRDNSRLEAKLASLSEEMDRIKAQAGTKAATYQQETSEQEKKIKDLLAEKKSLISRLAELRNRYDLLAEASRDTQATLEHNNALQAENKILSKKITDLEDEADQVFKTGMIKWFLAGVGVLLLGWIIGQNVSSNRKRRSSLLD